MVLSGGAVDAEVGDVGGVGVDGGLPEAVAAVGDDDELVLPVAQRRWCRDR
jgi:hypothetical protein